MDIEKPVENSLSNEQLQSLFEEKKKIFITDLENLLSRRIQKKETIPDILADSEKRVNTGFANLIEVKNQLRDMYFRKNKSDQEFSEMMQKKLNEIFETENNLITSVLKR